MNAEFQEVTDEIEVPTHAGVEGFFAALRKILKQPRVTNVNIDVSGKVTYSRFARVEEPRKHIEVDFESVSPGALVRNIELTELDVYEYVDNASICIAAMFQAASLEQMFPVGFVTGANTTFLQWHKDTTGIALINNSAYGLPIYRDRFIPDETLLLVTAFARGAGLVDARKSYKIAMPSREVGRRLVPVRTVDIQPPVLVSGGEETVVLAQPPDDEEVKVIE
jgi:hypothetical protein